MLSAAALLALGAFPPAGSQEAGPATPPNVLVLLLDDLGLEVLAAYDRENLYPPGVSERVPNVYPKTPNIERLAREGVRFTQARVPPTCSPTRATVLSGRYPFRHGIGAIIRRADTSPRYEQAETIEFGVGEANREWTLAHLARAAGQRSFAAGKWHLALLNKHVALGGGPGYGWDHVRAIGGFDDYWAIWGNLPGYPKPDKWTGPDGMIYRPGYYNFVAGENGVVANVAGEYVTSQQATQVLEFVDAHADGGWLIYCPFNAVHSPFQLPPDELVATEWYLERGREEMTAIREMADHQRSTWPFYGAMVEALDHEIGRILDGLEERGVLDRTVVFLLGDNGAPEVVMRHAIEREGLDLGPLVPELVKRGGERFKHTVWEPGVRVPLIVRGPAVGSPGRDSDVLVDAPDLFETIRELLGVTRADAGIPADHRVDGVSFLPVLRSPEAESDHLRRFSFVEHFEPNGNPESIVFEKGGMSSEYMLRRAFVLETGAGRFKLVRNRDRGSDGRDKLFQLTDAAGQPVDPWEQNPLRVGKTGEARERLEQLQEEMEALLRTEGRNWR